MSGGILAAAGFALVAGAASLWFWRARAVRLQGSRAGYVAAWLGGAVLGAGALLVGAGWLAGTAAVLALLVGGLLCALVAVSPQKVGAQAIRVGDAIPEFSASDEHGVTFRSVSLAGRPALLKFFRGHW